VKYGRATTCFPSGDSPIEHKDAIGALIGTSRSDSSYLKDNYKLNLQCDKLDLMGEASSTFTSTCDHTDLTEVFIENPYFENGENFATCVSAKSVTYQNEKSPFPSLLEPGKEQKRNLIESMNRKPPYGQESQMLNFENYTCNPTMGSASPMYHGAVEFLDQNTDATGKSHKEQEISVQSEDALMNIKEQIIDLPESIKNYPSHLKIVQKSDLRNFPGRNRMGSSSSINSEPCLRTNLSELDSKNHHRSHSSGSLDSSHIDILNDIHLQELDTFLQNASLL